MGLRQEQLNAAISFKMTRMVKRRERELLVMQPGSRPCQVFPYLSFEKQNISKSGSENQKHLAKPNF